MLLTKEVDIIPYPQKYYEDLGYAIPKRTDKYGKYTSPKNTRITVDVNDLPKGSHALVEIKCDCESCENPYLKPTEWRMYLKCLRDGKYYCQKCALNLFGFKKSKETRFKNSMSFKDWCLNNDWENIIERFDEKLNDCTIDEISYSTNKAYYFKCEKELHPPELKAICDFVSGHKGSIECKACNSFAQWGIDNLGEDFLEKYWDYKKNKADPWKVSYGGSTKKVFINCQENSNHKSYYVRLSDFTISNSRCPLCQNSKGEEKIRNFLIKNNFCKINNLEYNIENNLSNYFIQEKIFEGLYGVNNSYLRFDFYLPEYNLCIEYDGKHHYETVNFGGISDKIAKNKLKVIRIHDYLKNEYCKKNKIKLIRIPYWDFFNLEEILSKEILSL